MLTNRAASPNSAFTHDAFQRAAVEALDRGSSVLVAAPTGSGKTVVAEHAIDLALANGGKAFYTTPLKALSNQKHRDLSTRLGAERVGLLTGDRVVNPDAPVVVMTTEVLRAMLHERTPLLDGLEAIVLDEFHYLQDPDRGPVWEEVCIHAPSAVKLVCLSATVASVDELTAWLCRVHGPTVAVVEDRRPVTLDHLYAVGNIDGTPPLMLPMFVDGALNPTAELFDGQRRRQLRGEGLRQRSRTRPCPPTRRQTLDTLRAARMLPAIWFVLSRAGCDRAVAECHDEGIRLTSPDERHEVRDLAESAMGAIDAADLKAIGYGQWLAALESGIAAHHGGMLPVQREVVEAAFAAGLVKVAFATETLALGVNLPARSVVIDRVVRANGDRSRSLSGAGEQGETITASDFAQLAGRAGRRGIDSVGHVVVPWAEDVPFSRVASLAGGRPPALRSTFHPTPAMAANLIRGHTPEGARAVVRSSLAQHLRDLEAVILDADLESRRRDLVTAEAAGQCTVCDADAAAAPSGPVSPTDDGAFRSPVDLALADLEPGDVIVDPARPAFGRVVVVAAPRQRRGSIAVDVVGPDARRSVITARDLRAAPLVTSRLPIQEWRPQERGHARVAARALMELPPVPVPTLGHTQADAAAARTGCPEGREHRAARTRSTSLTSAVADLEIRIDALRARPDEELDAVVDLLHRRRHAEGWRLSATGQAVRRLFHESGLLVAECLGRGLFDDLDAPSVAALASCFTARRRGPDVAPSRLPTEALSQRWTAIGDLARELTRAEEEAGLPPTPFPEPVLSGAIHRWASGSDLQTSLAGSAASAGDLVREVKQVVELLEQLADAAGSPETAARALEASESMMRGIVVATALVSMSTVR